MEKAFEKLLKKLLLEKYPIYLDVHVGEYGKYNPNKKICYEVHLFVFLKDYKKLSREQIDEVKKYINTLGKYIDIKVCGVYYEAVDEEEWEEIKSSIM
jgi:hypothetical protein